MRASATVAVALVATAALAAQPGALTPADFHAAIVFGERNHPRPYRLRHAGPAENPVVVGAIYTPFLRVALLARAAADRGEHLDPVNIDPRVTEPLVYIAFRWYCCDSVPGQEAADSLVRAEPQVVMLPIAARAPQSVAFTTDPRRGATRPVWLRPGTAVIEAFGEQPYDDLVLVAAFPADVLQPGRPFAIYKDHGDRRSTRVGVIRADDVAAWR